MQIRITTDSVNKDAALILPIEKNGHLSAVLQQIATEFDLDSQFLELDFAASAKEIMPVQGNTPTGKIRMYLLGLGENPTFATWLQVARTFFHNNRKKLPLQLQVAWSFGNRPENLPLAIEGICNGFCLGEYKIGRFKTGDDQVSTQVETSLEFLVAPSEIAQAKTSAQRGQAFAETQSTLIDLVNAPSNYKNPIDLSNWALRSSEKHQFTVRVMEKAEIEKTGLHGLLAVNRGSEYPATFTIMEYIPNGPVLKKVGLVGKGVTFDSGGLSIKPSANMHFMKSDMGGAAAVFGTLEMAAKLKLPIHLIGIVPATDNSVDALSVKPSDIISSYSGKSIEIIDTDAEGRLILADGLSYMVQNYQPEILIDLATLTGSVIRSLGYVAGGLFSNNEELSKDLISAGQRSGERLWPFPIWEEYGEMIRSDMADVKNFSGKPMAGAITAAKFLEHFIHDHTCWAHLDIAGVAMSDTEFSMQKSATAFGVRLLIDFLENLD
ncbi:MAG: leucyl aminopeptidase family protein [Saprospiraceae bacterium]|nr:leucyl aminopeptidase family protein [Saprospiraceae bacterium]